MILPKLIAYSWVLSVMVAVAVAADRGHPIGRGLLPIKTYKSFIWQTIFVVWVCLLVALQVFGCPDILGQRPALWALLFAAGYSVFCIGDYVCRRD